MQTGRTRTFDQQLKILLLCHRATAAFATPVCNRVMVNRVTRADFNLCLIPSQHTPWVPLAGRKR